MATRSIAGMLMAGYGVDDVAVEMPIGWTAIGASVRTAIKRRDGAGMPADVEHLRRCLRLIVKRNMREAA